MLYIHCTWVPHIVCIYHYCICHCVLACTAFDMGMYYAIIQESIIVYIQGYTLYVLPKNGLARVVAFLFKKHKRKNMVVSRLKPVISCIA